MILSLLRLSLVLHLKELCIQLNSYRMRSEKVFKLGRHISLQVRKLEMYFIDSSHLLAAVEMHYCLVWLYLRFGTLRSVLRNGLERMYPKTSSSWMFLSMTHADHMILWNNQGPDSILELPLDKYDYTISEPRNDLWRWNKHKTAWSQIFACLKMGTMSWSLIKLVTSQYVTLEKIFKLWMEWKGARGVCETCACKEIMLSQ